MNLHLLEKLCNHYEPFERINNGLIAPKSSRVNGIIYMGMHGRYLDSLFELMDCPPVLAYAHSTARRITRCATGFFIYFPPSG